MRYNLYFQLLNITFLLVSDSIMIKNSLMTTSLAGLPYVGKMVMMMIVIMLMMIMMLIITMIVMLLLIMMILIF